MARGRSDLAVPIYVRLPDHLVHLLVRQLLPQVSHHLDQGKEATQIQPEIQDSKENFKDNSSPLTCLSSAAEMKPLPSLSKTLKASRISSSLSVSFIFLRRSVRSEE